MNNLSDEILTILQSTPLGENSNFLLKTQCAKAGVNPIEINPEDIPKLAYQLETALPLFIDKQGIPVLLGRIRGLGKDSPDEKEKEKEETWAYEQIREGESYIVAEGEEAFGFEILKSFVDSGLKGLCISRTHPDKIIERYSLRGVNFHWLSKTTSPCTVAPTNLDGLMGTVNMFLTQNPKSVLVLDGLEYLTVYNDFNTVIKYVHELEDGITLTKSRMLIPINPIAFSDEKKALLQREMRTITKEALKKGIIEDVFLIHRNGCLLAHNTRRLKPAMDDEILSGMLTAVQDFIKDAFKDEKKWELRRLEFGDSDIMIERGKFAYLAVIHSGENDREVERRMKEVLTKVERKYGKTLAQWDGNLDSVRGTRDMIREIFR